MNENELIKMLENVLLGLNSLRKYFSQSHDEFLNRIYIEKKIIENVISEIIKKQEKDLDKIYQEQKSKEN